MYDAVIPAEFRAALEMAPDDLTLRRAIADRLMELGDEEGAEALVWSIEKERTPENREGYWGWANGHWKWATLPEDLYDTEPSWSIGELPWGSLDRLILKWRNSAPEQRKEYWSWNPQ